MRLIKVRVIKRHAMNAYPTATKRMKKRFAIEYHGEKLRNDTSACAKKDKLHTRRRGSMNVEDAKSSLLCIVDCLDCEKSLPVNAQRTVPNLLTKQSNFTLEKLCQQNFHYYSSYYLIDELVGAWKAKKRYHTRTPELVWRTVRIWLGNR